MIDPISYSGGVDPPPVSPQLTEAHLGQLSLARASARKIRRAVTIANFDGWSVGVFGGFSLMFAVIGGIDIINLLIGVLLVAIALIELKAAKNLGRLDPHAPRVLGFNQLALAALIIAYSLWRLHTGIASSSDLQQVAGADADVAGMVAGLSQQISRMLYGSLILFAIGAQGGMALYYFSRAKLVRSYLEKTPDWIITMQKSGVAI